MFKFSINDFSRLAGKKFDDIFVLVGILTKFVTKILSMVYNLLFNAIKY